MEAPKTRRSAWAVTDRWMRLFHLYTGIFLVPWMVVYGLSALLLNHGPALNKLLGMKPPAFKQVAEAEYHPAADTALEPKALAQALREQLNLEGAFRIQPKAPPLEMRILRVSGSGNYQVLWRRDTGKLRVMKQGPPSALRFINFLHFRAGYGFDTPAYLVWAVIVDGVGVSILFWVLSGIYLWARQPRVRLWGGVTLLGGLGLFTVLAWVMFH